MRKEKEKKADKNKDSSIKEKIFNLISKTNTHEEGQITKTKCFEIKPISVDDAKLKLSSSDDTFLAFVNCDTKMVNVLYKRTDNTFGLVIPE